MKDFFENISKLLPEDELSDFKNACNISLRKSIRFLKRINQEKLFTGFTGDTYKLEEQIKWEERGFYLDKNSRASKSLDYIRGDFYIQEAAAMYPVSSLFNYIKLNDNQFFINKSENKNVKYILDYSASPGGKTIQLADYFTDSIIVSNEIINGRLSALKANIIRNKLTNIILLNQNSTFYEKSNLHFDIILADLPCSGETLIFKKKIYSPDWSYKEVLFNSKRQKKICSDLLRILDLNSYFLYSTCTFSEEENEKIVEFLQDNGLKELNSKRLWPHRDNCAGGFSSILQNSKIKNISNLKSKDYISEQTSRILKILAKNPIFDLDKISKNGYLYQKDNVIYLFSFPEVLKILYDNCILLGLPLAKIESYGIIPLWNSLDYSKDDKNFIFEDDDLIRLSKGEDLRNSSIKGEDGYFVIGDSQSNLFLVKKVENNIKNLIPSFLIIK